MSRQEFSAKVKVAAFERAGGRCENCRNIIRYGAQYDHRVPDAVGGEPTIDNCQVLCKTCHGAKTAKQDIPAIAKTKRIRNKRINAGPKRQGFKGWRKFNGEIVWR
jgi:5-methylcytosine-specific restriction endonuclease McrA